MRSHSFTAAFTARRGPATHTIEHMSRIKLPAPVVVTPEQHHVHQIARMFKQGVRVFRLIDETIFYAESYDKRAGTITGRRVNRKRTQDVALVDLFPNVDPQ